MEVKHFLDKEESLVIYQDTDLNSYTFDSLLLAHFAEVKKNTNEVVDLCSGNGPVAMLLTKKKKTGSINITGVEIQKNVYDLGVKSVYENKLSNVNLINDNVVGINSVIGNNKFDLITVNPPYFKVDENSNLNDSDSVSIARHEILLTLDQLINECRILLSNVGSLCIVFRPERLDELIVTLDKHNFKVRRLQFVYPKKNKKCNTILVEAKKASNNAHMHILEPFYVYNDDNTYTDMALEVVNQ